LKRNANMFVSSHQDDEFLWSTSPNHAHHATGGRLNNIKWTVVSMG
jgi:hypothetical protein